MVALVNDHVSIFGHKVLDLFLAMQALNNRYVDSSSPFGFAPTDLADLVDRPAMSRCKIGSSSLDVPTAVKTFLWRSRIMYGLSGFT